MRAVLLTCPLAWRDSPSTKLRQTIRINNAKVRREVKLLIIPWARHGSLLTKNSTRTCLPMISVNAIAKAIAIIWEKPFMSTEPGTGRRKTLDPTISIQVTAAITSNPATPIHSSPPLTTRFNLSNLFKKLPNLTLIISSYICTLLLLGDASCTRRKHLPTFLRAQGNLFLIATT